jgi:ribosomal protein S18 acetylase RimI-like enzyme
MPENEVEKVAYFIATLNKQETFHIGYCGKDNAEIAQYIKEDIPYTTSFITAYHNETLVGVLGHDPDINSGNAEIWGPFVLEDYWGVLNEMWDRIVEKLPKEISTVSLFPNKKNKHVIEFAGKYNFSKQSEDAILVFDRAERYSLGEVPLEEIKPYDYDALKQLHDLTFPSTYYNGEQIIERLNENNKVFIIKDNDELSGYIYVEAEPKYGDATIEFFGVSETKRGQGLGAQLLKGALMWLFTFETIGMITLCVNTKNDKAIRLYQNVGFRLQHELCFYKKKIERPF